ncbi:hypothetical protein ACKVMU_05935 [Enterococcus mundtii]|uniref:hypothetical protein n=1 Tax=Enterococcus mundtii TaxID=53346 RepID=UPI0038FD0D3F
MNNELSTLDQYLTNPDWGKTNIEKTRKRKVRRNLLTDEELACDQDDLGNFVSLWDHIYLIHLSKHSNKPEYIYVIEDGLIDALEEYERGNLIDISYYGQGKKYIAEMEAAFDERNE